MGKNPKYFSWNQYWYFYQLKPKFVALCLMFILTYDSDGNPDTWKIFPGHGKLIVWEIQKTRSWGGWEQNILSYIKTCKSDLWFQGVFNASFNFVWPFERNSSDRRDVTSEKVHLYVLWTEAICSLEYMVPSESYPGKTMTTKYLLVC